MKPHVHRMPIKLLGLAVAQAGIWWLIFSAARGLFH